MVIVPAICSKFAHGPCCLIHGAEELSDAGLVALLHVLHRGRYSSKQIPAAWSRCRVTDLGLWLDYASWVSAT